MTDPAEATDPAFLETVYEALATAIDSVRDGGDEHDAHDREAQFLAQVALIALNRIGDADVALSVIDRAAHATRTDRRPSS